jgi:hypothetical protein
MRRTHSFSGLILWVGLAACSGSTGGDGGSGGSIPGADAGPDRGTGGAVSGPDTGTGGSGGQASVLGTTFGGGCGPEAVAFGEQCTAEEGFWDYCNNVGCTHVPDYRTICYPPPPAPATDEFACGYLNCKVGQVCRYEEPLGDDCATHSCETPPAPCDTTPTCACIEAAAGTDPPPLPGWMCTEDAAGNATLSGFSLPHWN